MINFSVATGGHRDLKDLEFCAISTFRKDWKGGKLCLYEAKLVIDLRPGDIIIFPSGRITHFNLHFEGEKGSLVLHTDRELKRAADDCNGWVIMFVGASIYL